MENTVPCQYCGKPTTATASKKCVNCYEVVGRLSQFLGAENGRAFVRAELVDEATRRACASDEAPIESKRVRGFYQLSRSWHRHATMTDGRDSFEVGIYWIEPENGTDGEFEIGRTELTDTEDAWRLKAFDDSWKVFGEFADFFAMLATLGEDPTAEQIRTGLVALGIVDLTKEERPK